MWISNAYAQGAGSPEQGFIAFLPMIAIFIIFYFMLIRPQQKKGKEQKAMIDALSKGDEVVTAGGIVGKVMKINENYVTLEIASGTEISVQRSAIGLLLPKGTMKTL
jgi:preprotein translocase subunit YajC